MADLTSSYQKTGSDLKKLEKRLKQVQLLIKHISQYQRTKPVYDQYRKAKKRDEYFNQHSADITIYEASRDTLKSMQTGDKLPSLSSLVSEQEHLVQEQQRLYDERQKLDKDRKKIETMKRNVDSILGVGQKRKETDQEVVKDNNRE
jgi:mevalonate kinase